MDLVEKAHRVQLEVYDERKGRTKSCIPYRLINLDGSCIARRTCVWRAFRDTLAYAKDGNHLSPEQVEPRIMKEWPQESTYQRLQRYIPETRRDVLSRSMTGADLGVMDARDWEMTSLNSGTTNDQRHLHIPPTPDAPFSQVPFPPPNLPTPTECTLVTPQDPATTPTAPPAPCPTPQLPYSRHQTFSWAVACGYNETFRERSKIRFVVDEVGRPITEFRDTRELVRAFRDAIIGHRLMWEKAGVLHRNLSIGNILITNDLIKAPFTGFIHDFNYSSMIAAPLSDVPQPVIGIGVNSHKERTVTHYFTACALLKKALKAKHRVHHDLESLYWVLLWVALHHTTHSLGREFCSSIFKSGDDWEACGVKMQWLHEVFSDGLVNASDDEGNGDGADDDADEPKSLNKDLIIYENEPLTDLMRELRCLVSAQVYGKGKSKLTYEKMLPLFDRALEQNDWPEKDHVPWIVLDPDAQESVVAPPVDVPPEQAPHLITTEELRWPVQHWGCGLENQVLHSKKRSYLDAIGVGEEDPEDESPTSPTPTHSRWKKAKVDHDVDCPQLC
ncbi:hypothetical protein C8Q76DRAFT_749702 [Earliella scabrosa]|nr:hypothetical protein C8Q76DRAFT_749702 [Earliella scabrosa]